MKIQKKLPAQRTLDRMYKGCYLADTKRINETEQIIIYTSPKRAVLRYRFDLDCMNDYLKGLRNYLLGLPKYEVAFQ